MPQSPAMGSALAFARAIDRLAAALGRAAAWLALAIVLVQFGLVVARYVFSAGSVPLTESVIYGQALLVTLTAAWTLAAGGHVRTLDGSPLLFNQERPWLSGLAAYPQGLADALAPSLLPLPGTGR